MDIVHDHSKRQLLRIADCHPIPEWAGSGELVADKAAADALPDTHFADDHRRLFPIKTAADVWVSAAYFNEARGEYAPAEAAFIDGRIKQAAAVHGVADDVERVLAAKPPAPVEDADTWCLVRKDASGNVAERGFPIADAEGVKLACEYLELHRDSFPYGMAREIAENICKRASVVGGEPTDLVWKLAGVAVPDIQAMAEELSNRIKQANDPNAGLLYGQLLLAVADAPVEESAKVLDKVAEAIEGLDRLSGVVYRKGHLRPEDIVFGLPLKLAQAVVEDVVQLDRYSFSLSKLASLDAEMFAPLGDDFIGAVKKEDGCVDRAKLAQILPTLPAPDKRLLEEHLMAALG